LYVRDGGEESSVEVRTINPKLFAITIQQSLTSNAAIRHNPNPGVSGLIF